MPTNHRVLLITDRYLPEVGGSITWFENCYCRYQPGTVWIVTQDYPKAREHDAAHPEVRTYRTGLKRYTFLKPESLLIYLKLFLYSVYAVLRHRIQIIYASKVLPEGFIARLVSKLLRVPYVVYAHGEEITVFGKNPKLAPKLPKIYDAAAAVITNSRFTREQLVKAGCHGKNACGISPGVDPRLFKPGPRDAEIIARFALAGKTILLSVGRLQKRKGHDQVISALPAILKECPDFVYLILSPGEEEENLRRLAASLDVAEAVRFVGEVPYRDLPRYYNTCDIFILANRRLADGDVEGFGIVFLEANACCRPVIAGDSGGTGDPVRDGWNGFRVNGHEIPAIAEAVLKLARDPELCALMGRNGRQLVESEYTWERVVEKTLALEASLLDPPESQPPKANPSRETASVGNSRSAALRGQ